MNYALEIRKHNQQAHIDIEQDIAQKKNGLFTMILRVNNGNIVDYSIMEYVNASKYLSLKRIIITELTIAHHHRTGSAGDTLRSDNNQRGATGGSSQTGNTQHRQEQTQKVQS